jgi:hypothetical protein
MALSEGVSLLAARRLVAPVPDVDRDDAALARRIWTLAVPKAQIIALTRNWAESARMGLSVVAECGLIGWFVESRVQLRP